MTAIAASASAAVVTVMKRALSMTDISFRIAIWRDSGCVLNGPVRSQNRASITLANSGRSVFTPLIFSEYTFITLAARHRLPAVYPYLYFVSEGGLIFYGPDAIEQFRRAASCVDRILKGESPTDLPVQHPTKYNFSSSPHYLTL
jgi:hypothetical protein